MDINDFHEVEGNFVEKNFKGRTIIDKGEVLVENRHEEELLLKYINALIEGNEFYRPEGLKFS